MIIIFFVKSSDIVPPCPICEGELHYRDSRKRIRKKEGGTKEFLQIRRFRCQSCQTMHNELPDCLVPHKHYEAEVISGVIDGVVTSDDEESEDYPCLATMLRWLAWFQSNLQNIEGFLRRALKLLPEDLTSSLLEKLRKKNQRWLETTIRIIYNSGGENLFIPINYEINFSNNKEEDIFLILISSLFFCILNKMKEPQKGNYINDGEIKDIKNNINNSRIIKFFSNTVNNIVTYIDNCKYDIKNLINSLFIFVMNENNISDKEKNSSISLISIINSQKENIEYDFKMIEEMIMNSDDNNLKERFNSLKKGLIIEPFNLPQSLIGTFFKRVIGVFTTNSYYYANYIRLSPFQKFISSNIVSIFISGFGSENDAHSIEWRKYLENAPDNTNYYFYHWPADSFTKIVIKSLPISLSGIGIDSDLPKVFLDSKKKAATCGKILALIIKSNLFFEKRQINLVAFSLGNHVVKSCLRELSTYDDNKCIINDVTFIAGATTFKNKINWYNRFKRVVGGRIINCYSDKDYILKLLYKNCTGNAPIGNHAININNGFKDGKNIIENYDFSDLKLGHLDYRKNFNKIIKRIMK